MDACDACDRAKRVRISDEWADVQLLVEFYEIIGEDLGKTLFTYNGVQIKQRVKCEEVIRYGALADMFTASGGCLVKNWLDEIKAGDKMTGDEIADALYRLRMMSGGEDEQDT